MYGRTEVVASDARDAGDDKEDDKEDDGMHQDDLNAVQELVDPTDQSEEAATTNNSDMTYIPVQDATSAAMPWFTVPSSSSSSSSFESRHDHAFVLYNAKRKKENENEKKKSKKARTKGFNTLFG